MGTWVSNSPKLSTKAISVVSSASRMLSIYYDDSNVAVKVLYPRNKPIPPPIPVPVQPLQQHNLIPPNRRIIHTPMLPSLPIHRDRVLGDEDRTAGRLGRAEVRHHPRVDPGVLAGDPGVRRRHGRRVGARVAAAPLGPERVALAVGVAVAYDVPEGGSGASSVVCCQLVCWGRSAMGWCVSVWAGHELR